MLRAVEAVQIFFVEYVFIFRSSCPEMFLRKGVLKICSKFTGEHSCRSVISIKLLGMGFLLKSCWIFLDNVFLRTTAQYSPPKMIFCNTSQTSQKGDMMESIFVKLQALISEAVVKRAPSLGFSCEYNYLNI